MRSPQHNVIFPKYTRWAVYALLTTMVIMGALTFYWLLQPRNPLEVRNAPFPIRTIRPEAHPDGVVILKVDYCKKTNAVGRVRTSFVSPTREVFLPIAEDKQSATCQVAEIPVLIPKSIPPDTYVIKFRVTYDINPLVRNVVSEFESKPFEVKP